MGKKDRTFGAKMAKGAKAGNVCPQCGETLSILKVVGAEKSDIDSYKFKENIVGVCKCNEKEIYG